MDITPWVKTSSCGPNGPCAEVTEGAFGQVAVRNSGPPYMAAVWFDAGEWEAFTAAVKAGEFDPGFTNRRTNDGQ